MAVQIAGGSSSAGIANVTPEYALLTATSLDETKAGFTAIAYENDAGDVTGSRMIVSPEVSHDFRQRVGVDVPLFNELFPGTTINTSIWTAPVTTFTVTQTAGSINLNGTTAANGVARVASWRSFPVFSGLGLTLRCRVKFAVTPQANTVHEWGMFIAATTSAPTDGVFFRINASQVMTCVVNANGTEIVSEPIDFATLIGTTSYHNCAIDIQEDTARFWIDDALVAEVFAGAGPTTSGSLPIASRIYNTASAAALAQTFSMSSVSVVQQDGGFVRSTEHGFALAGCGAYQNQTGSAVGQTANFANSANPAAAVPTNTTAALGTGLGGQFWETDTLAANTDGIICSYQVPAGTAALPGKCLVVTGITIDSFVQTGLTGGGYNAVWSLAAGHTAVSLATTDSVTTKAPRRIPLGVQTVASGALATAQLQTISRNFNSPIVVNPGEFIAAVKKKVGTAPSGGVIAHIITINGYFE